MTNHVHLLLQPEGPSAGLGKPMKALAARMTRYRNRLDRRSGDFVGKPLQIECCAFGRVPALVLSLH